MGTHWEIGCRSLLKGEQRGFLQDLLSTLGVETESEERPQQVICCRTVDETGGLDVEEKRQSEDLKVASLLHWLINLLVWQGWLLGSQGMVHGVSGWDNRKSWRNVGEELLDLLVIGS